MTMGGLNGMDLELWLPRFEVSLRADAKLEKNLQRTGQYALLGASDSSDLLICTLTSGILGIASRIFNVLRRLS
jgi:hypothetical protein